MTDVNLSSVLGGGASAANAGYPTPPVQTGTPKLWVTRSATVNYTEGGQSYLAQRTADGTTTLSGPLIFQGWVGPRLGAFAQSGDTVQVAIDGASYTFDLTGFDRFFRLIITPFRPNLEGVATSSIVVDGAITMVDVGTISSLTSYLNQGTPYQVQSSISVIEDFNASRSSNTDERASWLIGTANETFINGYTLT